MYDTKSLDGLEGIVVEIWTLKEILVKNSKGRAVEKVPIVLENTYIIMNRMLLEIGTLKCFW